MYNISFHTFQIVSVITQELCSANIMVLSEFDKRVLNAKIDFLINAINFRKCRLFVSSPKIRTIKCCTETSTQFNKHMFATFVKHSKESV